MEFQEIDENLIVYPGEYVLYKPKNQIVLCGAFDREQNVIRALSEGRLLEDTIENFNKIVLTPQEAQQRRTTRCKGCGSR